MRRNYRTRNRKTAMDCWIVDLMVHRMNETYIQYYYTDDDNDSDH